MENVSLQQIINRIPLLKYRYFVSILSDYTPILPNETFAIIKTQPSIMQGEHWIMIANSRHNLYFADSLSHRKHIRQQCRQMMPEPVQSHPSVCKFYTIYAAFHLFKFRRKKFTGVRDVYVLSHKSNYFHFFKFFNVNVPSIQCDFHYLYYLINF